MGETDVIKKIIKDIEKAKIPYLISGGFAVNVWGRIRTTHDLDVIIAITSKDIKALKKIFVPDEFYFSEEAAKDAVLSKGTFNVIHHETGLKIDFWILQDDIFGKSQIRRRVRTKFLGQPIYFISPEDLILIKLKWYKESESDRHFFDALSVYQTQKRLNKKYLKKWSELLNVSQIFNKLIKLK
jgi:hypothetical protein